MATLRKLLETRGNDYSPLEAEYLAATGGELVLDPLGSVAKSPARLTRSASVLIGSYNSRETLRKTILSIEQCSFNRKYPDLVEVVVVDDGSTDGTREMIAGLEAGVRIKYIRQDQGGLTRAHNTGLGYADGEILIFSDSDIVHTEYAIEELMKRHEVLRHVTLVGFRFDIDAGDPRISFNGPWKAQDQLLPEFYHDFRLNFPGRPESMCRATRNWKDYGFNRTVMMSNGAHYNLSAMVVGAFFSIARQDYLWMGGSDERLAGWGCEDSLIGARSLGLENYIVPVYSAASAHIAHTRRTPNEGSEFAANIQTANRILDQEFAARKAPDCTGRVREYFSKPAAPTVGARVSKRPRRPLAKRFDAAGLGTIDYALGLYESSLQHFEDAIRATPESPWPYVGKGKALRELLRYGDAVPAFSEASDRDPRNGWARLELAITHAAAGEHEKAWMAVEAAREADPNLYDTRWIAETGSVHHKQRGNHHAAMSLHTAAVRDFDLAIAVDPYYAWAHYDRGLSLRTLGRTREALEAFRKTDELLHPQDRNRSWVHTQLGKTHADLGDVNRAKVQLEKAIEWYPANPQAQEALSALHARVEAQERCLYPLTVIRGAEAVDGWLTEAEGEGLIAAVLKAGELCNGGPPMAVVEIGSFCGKSTVILGRAVQSIPSRNLRLYAIDPHDNYFLAGGRDTWSMLRKNLDSHGLQESVELIRQCSTAIAWTQPIALLFIDGLHDYDNVKADFLHFKDHVPKGGLAAFHDYVDYCPGVRYLVNEVLMESEFQFAGQRERLIVLRKTQ